MVVITESIPTVQYSHMSEVVITIALKLEYSLNMRGIIHIIAAVMLGLVSLTVADVPLNWHPAQEGGLRDVSSGIPW